MSFTDPSGKVVPLIVAVGIGAIAGGSLNAIGQIIYQKLSGRKKIDWYSVGNSAVAGIIGGGLAAVGGGAITAMTVPGLSTGFLGNMALGFMVGGASAGTGQFAADMIAPPGKFLSPEEKEANFMRSAMWGAIGGAAGSNIRSNTGLNYAFGSVLSNGIGAASQSPYNPGLKQFHPLF